MIVSFLRIFWLSAVRQFRSLICFCCIAWGFSKFFCPTFRQFLLPNVSTSTLMFSLGASDGFSKRALFTYVSSVVLVFYDWFAIAGY